MAKISDFINQGDDKAGVVTAHIPLELRNKTVAQFKTDRAKGKEINWDKFLMAACLAYLDESKNKKAVG